MSSRRCAEDLGDEGTLLVTVVEIFRLLSHLASNIPSRIWWIYDVCEVESVRVGH